MTAITTDKPTPAKESGTLPENGIGAYASATGVDPSIAQAITNPSASSQPPAFTDSDKRWLKELGITTANPDQFKYTWGTDPWRYKPQAWNQSTAGRLAIRAFSRGVMGAIFFAAGQMWEEKAFENYNPETPLSQQKGILKFVAKLIDNTSGKAIEGAVKFITKNPETAKRAVTFRDTRKYAQYNYNGRSLGHESIGITLDMGLASLGDHTGREIASILDPNVKKSWIKDGKIDFPLAVKALLYSTWTGLSRAMGEDYFAMLMGYPYIVRMSRYAINKASPGFKFDSDHALNGGSFKINGEKLPGSNTINSPKIVGNYQLEGMIDLGTRFTVYNWYTKLFRDAYDWTAEKIGRWRHGDKSLDLMGDTLSAIKNLPYNIAHTIIKMTVIMIPSVPFFFLIRTPQSKDVGLAIHPEHGPLGVEVPNKDKPGERVFRNIDASGKWGKRRSEIEQIPFQITGDGNIRKSMFRDGTQVVFNAQDKFKGFLPMHVPNADGIEQRFNPYGEKVMWHDSITNTVGAYCNKGSHVVTEALKQVAQKWPFNAKKDQMKDIARFSRKAFYASAAYTPYFAMKTDTIAAKWDSPRMDMAVDRMLHGAMRFNWREFMAGNYEIGRTILDRPFADKDRELLARKEIRLSDKELADKSPQDQYHVEDIQDVIKGVNEKKFATEELKKKPLASFAESYTPAIANIKQRDPKWQQAVKQFQDLTPQGQTTH